MKVWSAALLALGILSLVCAPARAETQTTCSGSCTYLFTQLTMPADRFSRKLIPLFDDQLTFDAFTDYLDEHRIFYSLSDVCMPITDFPEPVQKAITGYGPGDNLIGKRGGSVLILKIQRTFQSPQACLANLPARAERETGAKAPKRAANTRAVNAAPKPTGLESGEADGKILWLVRNNDN
jgi:hypothetical protein